MENTDLQQIFIRFLAGESTPEEVKLLSRQFGFKGNETELRKVIRQHLESDSNIPEHVRQRWAPIIQDTYSAIRKQIDSINERDNATEITPMIHRKKWLRYSAAATIAILVTATIFVFLNQKHNNKETSQQKEEVVKRHDIAPGGNKAILTLANGRKIILDSVKKGMVSKQGNTNIFKLNNGQLAYQKSDSRNSTILFNTVTTPKGGQYQVVLSDGTKVWLNSASSIHFPNRFSTKMREVQITGEVYFEVAEDAKRPFKVLTNGLTIQVLGTHFNVMAYKDEPTLKVTLLQGAVKVIKENKKIVLSPGQQAQLNQTGRMKKVGGVDLQGVIAWKNNYFWFNDADIQAVMRQLSRWYNVDVVIKGNIPQHFEGLVSRNVNISKVFKALQATTHLQFKIQNDKVIVSP